MFRVLFLIFSFTSLLCSAQRIASFNAYPSDNTVLIRFVILSGPPCMGYTIYHSTDSINYQPIEFFDQQCGDGSDYNATYTHKTPSLTGINYYKVTLSTYENSPVVRVSMDGNRYNKLILFPNPLENYNSLGIRVQNKSNVRMVGDIYDQKGHSKRFLDFHLVNDRYDVPVSDLQNGMYMIWLTDGYQIYSSKLIIRR